MAKYPYDTFGSLDSIIKDYSDLKDSKIYKNINLLNYTVPKDLIILRL